MPCVFAYEFPATGRWNGKFLLTIHNERISTNHTTENRIPVTLTPLLDTSIYLSFFFSNLGTVAYNKISLTLSVQFNDLEYVFANVYNCVSSSIPHDN